MTQTQELIERLRGMAARYATETEDEAAIRRLATARAAADRLSQLEGEVGRLREALRETIIDLNVYADIGIIRARTIERRAALEHQDKGEKL